MQLRAVSNYHLSSVDTAELRSPELLKDTDLHPYLPWSWKKPKRYLHSTVGSVQLPYGHQFLSTHSWVHHNRRLSVWAHVHAHPREEDRWKTRLPERLTSRSSRCIQRQHRLNCCVPGWHIERLKHNLELRIWKPLGSTLKSIWRTVIFFFFSSKYCQLLLLSPLLNRGSSVNSTLCFL